MSVVLIKNDDDDDSSLRTDSADFTTGPFLLSISVLYLFQFLHYSFCLVPCGRLSWLLVSFWAHVNIVHRIVTYRIVCYIVSCSAILLSLVSLSGTNIGL